MLGTVPRTQSVLNKRAQRVPKGLDLTCITAAPVSPHSGRSSESWLFSGAWENSPKDINIKAGRIQLGAHRLQGLITTRAFQVTQTAFRFREDEGTKHWLLFTWWSPKCSSIFLASSFSLHTHTPQQPCICLCWHPAVVIKCTAWCLEVLLAAWPWRSHYSFLCLSFPNCKCDQVDLLHKIFVWIKKRNNLYEVHNSGLSQSQHSVTVNYFSVLFTYEWKG